MTPADVGVVDLIVDHARRRVGSSSVHRPGAGESSPAVATAERISPTCGDRITVALVPVVETEGGGTAVRYEWDGRGCEISQASASMLGELLDGVDVGSPAGRDRATSILSAFLAFMAARGAERPRGDVDLGDAEALGSVSTNLVRSTCASLAWHTAADALAALAVSADA